jgi:O-antigen/teichoic acid export membrane protein
MTEPLVDAVGGPADQVSGAKLLRNTAINGLAIIGGLVVTLVLTPFMLYRLGADAFGVWALALTLTFSAGYLTLADLGLQQAAVRFIADARRRSEPAVITSVFSTTLAIFSVVAVISGAVIVSLASVIASLFTVGSALHSAATTTFAVVGGQIVFDLPSMAFRAVLEASQRFAAIRGIDILRSLSFAAGTVVALVMRDGLVGVAAASAAAAAIGAGALGLAAYAKEPAARFRPSTIDRRTTKELLSFSGSLFALRILSVAYRQMDKLIIALTLTIGAVATYEFANKMSAALTLVFGIAGSALLPAATLSRADRARMRELFLRITSTAVAVFFPLALAAAVYARLLVVGWVGEGQAGATNAARLFFIWLALGTFDAAGTTMLVAIGRLRPVVILSVVWVVTNLGLSIALVHVWGITGVVAGTVITYGPLLVAYTVLCMREFRISLHEWATRVLLPNLPGPAVQLMASLLLLRYVERLPPLAGAALGGAVGVAVSFAVYLFVGLRREDRRELFRVLRGAVA